jgi:hypothetical protein
LTSLERRILDWQKENTLESFSGPLILPSVTGEDREEVEHIFLGREVHEIELESLACKDYLLLCLTQEALLHYLPRFLELVLTSCLDLDVFSDSLFSELNPPMTQNVPRNSWLDKFDKRLSSERKKVIAEVLKECRDKWGYSVCNRAIENFWKRYL